MRFRFVCSRSFANWVLEEVLLLEEVREFARGSIIERMGLTCEQCNSREESYYYAKRHSTCKENSGCLGWTGLSG